MAIAQNPLTSGSSDTNATSYATASVTPASNALVLIAVASILTGSVPPAPTLSGNGLTYVQVATVAFSTIAASRVRLTLFRALGASPSAGAITIDFDTEIQAACAWAVSEFSGVNTGGTNGSAAVVQSATDRVNDDATQQTLTVTLAAFADAVNNATYGTFSQSANNLFDPGTGFTQIHDVAASTPQVGVFTEWKSGGDTSVDAGESVDGADGLGGIAIEIGAAVATTTRTLAALGVGT